MMEFSKLWLWGFAEGWWAHEKEFAGLDCESGLLASPDGLGWVLGMGLFLCDGVFQDVALGFGWGMAGSQEGVCGIGLGEWAIGKPRWFRWGCWGWAIWFELVLEPHPEGEKYKVEFGLKVNLKTTLFLPSPELFGRHHVPALLHIHLVCTPSCGMYR